MGKKAQRNSKVQVNVHITPLAPRNHSYLGYCRRETTRDARHCLSAAGNLTLLLLASRNVYGHIEASEASKASGVGKLSIKRVPSLASEWDP
jgi:hypothetical protein